jgi:hypothetical protein
MRRAPLRRFRAGGQCFGARTDHARDRPEIPARGAADKEKQCNEAGIVSRLNTNYVGRRQNSGYDSDIKVQASAHRRKTVQALRAFS